MDSQTKQYGKVFIGTTLWNSNFQITVFEKADGLCFYTSPTFSWVGISTVKEAQTVVKTCLEIYNPYEAEEGLGTYINRYLGKAGF